MPPHEDFQKSAKGHFDGRNFYGQPSHNPQYAQGYPPGDEPYPPQEFSQEYDYPAHSSMFVENMHHQQPIPKEYPDHRYHPSQQQFDNSQSPGAYVNLRSTDRLLPIANISKIMKAPIPKVAKVAKDAKETMQKAASEFIAIVTSLAKDICEQENRKTLTGEDLIKAMEQLGMDFYANLGRVYMKRYREIGKSIKRRQFESLDTDQENQ